MLHALFTLERPLIVLDTETTGLKNARIVEIGFQVWTDAGLKKEWRSLVNPEMPMNHDAIRTHHITEERLTMCQICAGAREAHPFSWSNGSYSGVCELFHVVPTFAQLAPSLVKGFTDVDWAGKNIRFDLGIMTDEFARVDVPWSYAGARIIDAERLEQLGEPRTLSNLYRKHLKKEPLDAHQALADVQMTTEIIVAQLQTYTVLPRSLDMLHDLQWPGWIDTSGKFRFKDGVPVCTFGKYRDVEMRRIDSGYWSWIIKSDFSDEIKTLAREALAGRYPTK